MKKFAVLALLAATGGCVPQNAPNTVSVPSATAPQSATSAFKAGMKIGYDLKTEMSGMAAYNTSSSFLYEVVSVDATQATMKMTTTTNGQTNSQTMTVPATGSLIPATGSSASSAPADMASWTKVGSESVTVKAGTYTADKYTHTQDGANVTYWMANQMMVKMVMEANYNNMAMMTTVAAFEAVGAILVIAMVITPGATAHLLADRLPRVLLLAVGHGVLSAVLGMYVSVWFDVSSAGAMVTSGFALYGLAFLFAPRHGLLAKHRHRLLAAT